MKPLLQAVSGFNFLAIRAGMTGLLLTAAVVGVTCALGGVACKPPPRMLEKEEPEED